MARIRLILIAALALALAGCNSEKTAERQNEHKLNSSEYKLLLNPEMFDDYEQAFAEYWQIVKDVAAQENIPVIETALPMKIKHKDISFYDTENLDLRKNKFLLRYKRKYDGDHIKPGAEYTLKYRNKISSKVVAVDLSTAPGFTPKHAEIELESDIVYYADLDGRKDVSYTMANGIDLDEKPIPTIGELEKVYPVIKTLGLPADTELKLVAGIVSDERMVMPGKLEFGDGLFGRMDMTIWIMEFEGKTIRVPEFSFDHPFHADRVYNAEAMDRCTSFIDKLKSYKPEWVVAGKLKAAVVFDLACN